MTLVGLTALVGRDQYKVLNPGLERVLGDIGGAEDIVANALEAVGLDHRHMLVRRGVEKPVEPRVSRNTRWTSAASATEPSTGTMLDVAQLAQLPVNLIEREFALFQNDEFSRIPFYEQTA